MSGSDSALGDAGIDDRDALLLFLPEPPTRHASSFVNVAAVNTARPLSPWRRHVDLARRYRLPSPRVQASFAVGLIGGTLCAGWLWSDRQPNDSRSRPAAAVLESAPVRVPAAAPEPTDAQVHAIGTTSLPEPTPSTAARHGAVAATPAPAQTVETRAPEHHGALLVRSEPAGADVFINNEYAGRTPIAIASMAIGSRAIRLRLEGYGAWSRGVRIVANESTRVDAVLVPARPSP